VNVTRASAAFALAGLAALAGCTTYAAYEKDAPPPPGQAATIGGDPRFNAGLPLAVTIRQVDGRSVGARYARVAVAAGRHVLLVDCTLAATRTTTRHELEVEVEPGGDYRLVAESAPGNRRCGEVRMEPR
jgi:hypothetical protein